MAIPKENITVNSIYLLTAVIGGPDEEICNKITNIYII